MLLVMRWDMIDENAWKKNKAVSLTPCWSWDETWLMRLPGKEIKQCHSQTVVHRMRHDWWGCLISSVTHSLLVMWWDMPVIDETAWQLERNKAVPSLTYCWSWYNTWLMRLPSKEMQQSHSLAVGHGMRHEQWDCLAKGWRSVTHHLLVMGHDRQRIKAVSLTPC